MMGGYKIYLQGVQLIHGIGVCFSGTWSGMLCCMTECYWGAASCKEVDGAKIRSE